jgi:rRNA maturation protein Nop10
MTSSEEHISLRQFKEEFTLLAKKSPECGNILCIECPLLLSEKITLSSGRGFRCLCIGLCTISRVLPETCPSCGKIIDTEKE